MEAYKLPYFKASSSPHLSFHFQTSKKLLEKNLALKVFYHQ
ncbi:hypothetical protein HMPREF9966_0206 [Streptococcus anginosus SK52 = DSM 20563]|nr:hypothetical protein HMPREF9966_0206 [Streptococcus anginosus SK52 = DSM 20563]